MGKVKLAAKLGTILTISIAFLTILEVAVVRQRADKLCLEKAEEDYIETTTLYADKVADIIQKYGTQLEAYSKADIVRTKDPAQIFEWIQERADIRPQDFERVSFVDLTGQSISDISGKSNVKDRDYFDAIVNKNMDVYVDNPVTSKTTGKTILHVCKAARAPDGELVGFFMAILAIEHVHDMVSTFKTGSTGYSVLYSSDNQYMGTSASDEVAQEFKEPSEDMQALITKILDNTSIGNTGNFTYKDKYGIDHFGVYSPVKGTSWTFIMIVEQSEIIRLAKSINYILVIGGVLIALGIIAVSITLIILETKPLELVESTMEEIATGHADLTKRIILTRKNNDEIGRVVKGFNDFAIKLQNIVTEIKQSKDYLIDSGRDLSESTSSTHESIKGIMVDIGTMDDNIVNQRKSVNQTAGAVNEISLSLDSLNKMVESQSASVHNANAAVQELVGNIHSVNLSVSNMSTSFQNLKSKTAEGVIKQEQVNNKIQSIAAESEMLMEANSVISSIAEQTNLLAMNAAIEAAHAGEAGKGFSVVADEIRKLSENSASQSKTIGDELKKITDDIENIVVESNNASRVFNEVTEEVSSTSNLVEGIKTAMEEQESGSNQISDALQVLNDNTSEVIVASREMQIGNQMIMEEIKNLQDATLDIKTKMTKISDNVSRINDTGGTLAEISSNMKDTIDKIGSQVDLFKV